jgi:hypothetical protein
VTRPTQAAAGRSCGIATPSIEALESRTLLAVSVGSDGFTDFTASSDTRKVYVSSASGKDTNTGTSSTSPVRTIAKARSLMRSGRPDWMLLKRGDVFYESLGSWTLSGRSASEPMLISSYGTGARPMLNTGAAYGVSFSGQVVSNLVIKGIYFHAHTRDPGAAPYFSTAGDVGMRIVGSGTNLLLEDNVVDSYTENVVVDNWNGRYSNVKFRRNVVVDSYDPSDGNSQGMYVSGVDTIVIEGNVFDHNGWNSAVSGGQSNIYSHNIYMQSGNTGVTVKDNIIANASSHGLQARAGGNITNNLFIRNPIHLSFGFVNSASVKAGGVSGTIEGNVFYAGRDIAGAKRGWAIEISNTKVGGGTVIRKNVFAQDVQKAYAAIILGYGTGVENQDQAVGINDLTIQDNTVYNWHSAISLKSGLKAGGTGYNALNRLVVRDNRFQNLFSDKIVTHAISYSSASETWANNRYYDDAASSGWFSLAGTTTSYDSWKSKVESTAGKVKVTFVDPTRSIATYNVSQGGAGDFNSYMAEVRKQSETTWRAAYAAPAVVGYIQTGYSEGTPIPPPPPPPPPPPTSDTTAPTVLSYSGTATKISIRFSENVSKSLSIGDLSITNTSTGMKVSTSVMAYSYDLTTNTASWTFPLFSGARLPAGPYVVQLASQTVTDAAGNYLKGGAGGAAGNLVFQFTV